MSPTAKLVRVERQRAIRASQQRVYQMLSRVEGHPRFADLWLAADILEHGGGQVVAEFRGYFAGLPVDSVQRLLLRPPARVEFRQLRGTLKALRGEYVVDREGAGARLTARMEVEAGIPLLHEEAVRTVVTTALNRLISKVKDAAERDLPRLVPRKPGGPGAAAGAATPLPALVNGEEGERGEETAVAGSGAEQTETERLAGAPEGTLSAAPPLAAPPLATPRREGEGSAAPGRPGRRRRRRRHRRPRGPGGAP